MFNFRNVGRDIKNVAKFIGYCLFIPFCIGALVILVISIDAFNNDEVGLGIILLFASALVVFYGYLSARLAIMLTYGYGELIENSGITAGCLQNNGISNKNSVLPSSESETKKPLPNVEKTPFWKEMNQQKKITESKITATPVAVDSIRIQCPRCQRIQLKSRESCSECGAMFKF